MLKTQFNFACFFSLTLLLLLGTNAAAQDYPSPATRIPYVSLDSPASFTRADTARAIRRLFKSRRGGGAGWLGLGAASVLASTLPAQQSTSAGVWTPGVVAGSVFTLIGLNKRIQFRPENERQILRELAVTGRLAPNVSRRLRGSFKVTKGAASDYNPLLAEGIAPESMPALVSPVQAQAVAPSSSTLPLDTTQIPAAIPQQLGAARSPAQVQEMAYSDTLRAVSRLFERRRRGGGVWAGGGLSSALVLAINLVSPNADAAQ
ncbi:hypothetical protein D0N36_07495 [Hymenobacter lapidiphilus]|uniref:hypothetical protein n=1 Tax=Hymenobacter sp. CCM 8763 TaxID=2303334 RepID=UPI000E34EE3D|nr:hypothetical protein [Hymenobacter sp. CCM 8763]RFP65766.1 hypothetical protein D0N36_07495 [Hymenobacter sp. CCM 8763]